MSSVRAAHLLIKHTGSRNPISRRTGDQVQLRPDEALAELQMYQQRIIAEGVHEAFPQYAQGRSDWCVICKLSRMGYYCISSS